MGPPSSDMHRGYRRGRLTVIAFLIAVSLVGAIVSAVERRYPLGVAAVLFLIPSLLRELDLRKGRPMRPLGSFGWSCLIGGVLFLVVLPVLFVAS